MHRIITGVSVVFYLGQSYFIRDPRPFDLIKTEIYYEKILDDLTMDGVPTEDELRAILLDKGIWTSSHENKIEILKTSIKDIKKKLPALKFKSVEKKTHTNELGKLEKELKNTIMRKTYLLGASAEYLAKIEKYKKLLFHLTTDSKGDSPWDSWEDFLLEDDRKVNYLLGESYFNDKIGESEIRALARGEPWRSIWLTGSKTGNLYDGPAVNLTDYQKALASWSIVYDNIFEHPESPDQSIIDDDLLLDEWLEAQSSKNGKKEKGELITNDKIRNSQMISLPADSVEDARKIYDLNDPMSKEMIKKREKAILAKGALKEAELPDVRQNLQMEYNRMIRDKHGS
jgi:hypothetical protein